MKKKYFMFCMTLSIVLLLSGCSKNKSETGDEVTVNELEKLAGEYEYLSDSGTGRLIIEKNEYASYDISDYESQSSYRFLADSSNIESIENNRIYIKYPEQVFQDDTVIFCYYILEYGEDEMDVYYRQSEQTKEQLLYHATKKTEKQVNTTDSSADDEQLQKAISLWQEYYQEEVSQNRELYGSSGVIAGSMYTAISADVPIEKCRLTSFLLLSLEYELSGDVTFAENTATTDNGSEYPLSPQSFCIEYSSDFEEALSSYSINEKNRDELKRLIVETANKIEECFGHNFTEHTNKYVSFLDALYDIESDISKGSTLCIRLEENRLRLYATELLNIAYML